MGIAAGDAVFSPSERRRGAPLMRPGKRMRRVSVVRRRGTSGPGGGGGDGTGGEEGSGPAGGRDVVAVEEPLEIRLAWSGPDGRPLRRAVTVTMRTPGDDFELAAGFLFSEGLVRDPTAVAGVAYCAEPPPRRYNVVELRVHPGHAVDAALLDRGFYTSSSCGVCGRASLEAAAERGCRPLPPAPALFAADVLADLPERLRASQRVFRRTGGLHGAGLFDADGGLQTVREDVGRHNAVDKVVGEAFLRGELPLRDRALVVSGRASFELVQKAVAAGAAALVAVGAPSSLAVDVATRFDLTLVGFARGGGFNVYAAPERVRGLLPGEPGRDAP